MTEDEAKEWLLARGDVSRETFGCLTRFVELVLGEADHQSLISVDDRASIWARHIVDSVQLIDLAQSGSWADLGTGAGFPGLVIAVIRQEPIVLVEERRKRAEFLAIAVRELGLGHVDVRQQRVERMAPGIFANISARAFAPALRLFDTARHIAGPDTIWLLPKGRSAANELAAVRDTWQGEFRLERSVTGPDSAIIVATELRKGTGR